MSVRILTGDCRELLPTLANESVHCVVTSPPYWGLRDYGTGSWVGGLEGCSHTRENPREDHSHGEWSGTRGNQPASVNGATPYKQTCKCGAVRVDQQIGLERTLDEYLTTMVGVFREARRVLRKDGTLWLNMGDSYAQSGNGGHNKSSSFHGHADAERDQAGRRRYPPIGLKSKDLVGQPWRLAFALQAAGWYLRQDIIWAKPNPMPESVRDRCTKSHEYIFLLSKSEKYYYDAEAIKEPVTGGAHPRGHGVNPKSLEDYGDVRPKQNGSMSAALSSTGKKKPNGKKPAGWADFGLKSAIEWNAGPRTSKSGNKRRRKGEDRGCPAANVNANLHDCVPWEGTHRNKRSVWTVTTQPFGEAHFATFPPELIVPCILAGCPEGGTVLDPFGGAGTTGLVADRLGRNAILLELREKFADMGRRRIRSDSPLFAEVGV